ncbi:pentapeptide repeat-containing protein [Marinactinospora rubrisoli]|uniref:Pentapeptide repeat-containing protein n=1 Tax=Marinactinospora rubrisoli TaxID=2715399 RepID=A0ABW2KBM8_9ACTN
MRIPRTLADLPYAAALEPFEGEPEEDGDYDALHAADTVFEDAQASGARFIECAFTSVAFDRGRYRRARFDDVWIHGSRMTGVDLGGSGWQDVSVLSASLAGVAAFDSAMRRVVFSGCKLNAVNFRAAALTDVVFEDCVLVDVDFGEARLTKVRFPGSRLESARFDRATLSKVDLRGATAIDLASGYDALRGATIGSDQLFALAPALAQALGITVGE